MGDACIFCLENIQDQLPNVVMCPCEYTYHAVCLEKWFEEKGRRECPICHTVTLNVYVERQDYRNGIDKACGVCCCTLLFVWGIAFLVFRNMI